MVLKPGRAFPFPWESKEMMRNITLIVVAFVLTASGCSGGYDRELLGDPEPLAIAPAREAPAAEEYDAGDAGEVYDETPADYAAFDELDGYGSWRRTDDFGMVWQPLVVVGWQPYNHGHWIWTSYGWMWVSYEPFGWATYHYGYWWYDGALGWMWIPSYDWSPCTVQWFHAGNYIGWAPLPPPGHRWGDPWHDYGGPRNGWIVVEAGKFKEVDIGESRVPPARFKADYRNGTAVMNSPETRFVERATRQGVKETSVRIDTRRVGGRELKKIVYPEREREIADRFPMPVVNPGQGFSPPPRGDNPGVTTPPPDAKSKGTTKPPATERKPPKFKGGSKDDKGKDDGKSKGDKDKDDGKSKGGKGR